MLEKLYKRNVNGSINQWEIFIDENGYWSEYGQINGIITKSEKIIVTPKNIGKKNETTIEEQVVKEAISIWKKKIKSENYVVDINDVDKKLFNPPMLAQTYDGEYKKDIKFCQPKLDGIRCNMYFENGSVVAVSRKNNIFYTVEHIKESLFEILKNNPSLHIDGELYNHELHNDFNKVVSLVKKEKIDEDNKDEIIKYVRYNIYDMWDDNKPNLLFSERNKIINELFVDLPFIDIVETIKVTCSNDVEENFNYFISNGYEGLILRKDAIYEHKRSKNLLKYKQFLDEEFEILEICDGKAKNEIAEYAFVILKNNKICKATLSFSDELCKKIYTERDNLIGKKATVCFFGYTNDGMLRFPILKAIRDYE